MYHLPMSSSIEPCAGVMVRPPFAERARGPFDALLQAVRGGPSRGTRRPDIELCLPQPFSTVVACGCWRTQPWRCYCRPHSAWEGRHDVGRLLMTLCVLLAAVARRTPPPHPPPDMDATVTARVNRTVQAANAVKPSVATRAPVAATATAAPLPIVIDDAFVQVLPGWPNASTGVAWFDDSSYHIASRQTSGPLRRIAVRR